MIAWSAQKCDFIRHKMRLAAYCTAAQKKVNKFSPTVFEH